MYFRPDRDVVLPGHGSGQAVLSPAGRLRFAWARITLLVALGLLFCALVFVMTGLIRLEPWAGEAAQAQVERRLQADLDSRRNVAQVRQGILTNSLRRVIADEGASDGDKSVRIANLQALRAQQKRLVTEAEKHQELLGEFQPLTVITIDGKPVPVNNTESGKYRPEVIAAYIQNSSEISALLQAANKRALDQAPKNPEAIIRADIERVLAQKGTRVPQ